MPTDDFKYVELRSRVTNWIERKRDQHGKQLQYMERRQTTTTGALQGAAMAGSVRMMRAAMMTSLIGELTEKDLTSSEGTAMNLTLWT